MKLNENAWAGSSSNVYVAKYVLEKKLGCKVKVTNVTENQPSFQAMADGKIDVVLEDWDNSLVAGNQKYLKNGSVVNAGPLGVVGLIGWYIPRYLLAQYPQFKTWKGLKGKESVFKSPESGSQGMFLGGDPSYVQKDKEIIAGLGLNLKHVVAGAEPAQVARWTSLYKQKKPVLFYWYTPQYLNVQYDLVKVAAPGAHEGVCGRHDEEAQSEVVRVRLSADRPGQADQQQVREERLAGRCIREEVQVDGHRPEHGRQHDRRQEDEAGQGGRGLGQGEPR